jgi:hypothetical protein
VIFRGLSKLRSNINRLDIKFIFLITGLCLAITWIPYLYGYHSTPANNEYTGLVGRDVPGSYMYFMLEVQSQEGYNLFENRLTPERHERFYFNLEWWLLGRFLRYSGLSVIAGFHIERCITVFLTIVILYYFLSCFFQTTFERRCVLFLVLFTPGLGWVFWFITQYTSGDIGLWLWDIEGINLFGFLMHKPHFARSLAFVCLAYAFLLKGEEKNRRIYFFLAGLSVIIHGSIRPYNLPTAFFLFALFPALISIKEGRISKRRVENYLVVILTSLPIVVYYVYMRYFTIFKDVWSGVSLRPLTPLEFVIWLGVPLMLAILGFDGFKELKHKENTQIFLYLWGICLLALIYAHPLIPWGMEGAGPFCILAPIMAGRTIFEQCIPALIRSRIAKNMTSGKVAISIIAIIISISLPSNLILFRNTIKSLSCHSRPYYLPQDVVNAFEWLKQNAHYKDIVMSASNGFYLPTLSRVKAFTAHYNFTIDFAGKNDLVSRFFDLKEDDDFRKKLLQDYEVAYVFYSDVEQGMGRFDPKDAPFLQAVHENTLVIIFEVKRDRL